MKVLISTAALFAVPMILLAAPGAAPAPAPVPAAPPPTVRTPPPVANTPPPNVNTPPPNVNSSPPNVNTPPPMPQPQEPGSAAVQNRQGLQPGYGQVVQPGATPYAPPNNGNVQPYLNQNVQQEFQQGAVNQPAVNQTPMPPSSLSTIPTNYNYPAGSPYYNNGYYNQQRWGTNGWNGRMHRHRWNTNTNYINPNLPPRT